MRGPRRRSCPQMLINTQPITNHVRLLAIDDLILQNITQAIAEKRKAATVDGARAENKQAVVVRRSRTSPVVPGSLSAAPQGIARRRARGYGA